MNAPAVLKVGKQPAPTPEVRFWLEEAGGYVWLCAQHSEDVSDQRVGVIRPSEDGKIVLELRRLFAKRLIEALGGEVGDAICVEIEDRPKEVRL